MAQKMLIKFIMAEGHSNNLNANTKVFPMSILNHIVVVLPMLRSVAVLGIAALAVVLLEKLKA
jgi:hypothetical protein